MGDSIVTTFWWKGYYWRIGKCEFVHFPHSGFPCAECGKKISQGEEAYRRHAPQFICNDCGEAIFSASLIQGRNPLFTDALQEAWNKLHQVTKTIEAYNK